MTENSSLQKLRNIENRGDSTPVDIAALLFAGAIAQLLTELDDSFQPKLKEKLEHLISLLSDERGDKSNVTAILTDLWEGLDLADNHQDTTN